MNSVFWAAILASILCGIGTMAGAALGVCFKGAGKVLMSSIIAIAGGLMLSVVTLDLIPEALGSGGILPVLTGIALGILLVVLVESLLPESYHSVGNSLSMKSGVLLAIGLAIHNFPEGLAVGAGFGSNAELGIELMLVIALHDMPEGAAVAAGFLATKLRRAAIIGIAGLTAVPTCVGAMAGAALGTGADYFMPVCLGLAAGTMLYITCGELLPQSHALSGGRLSTLSILLGVVLGILITSAI